MPLDATRVMNGQFGEVRESDYWLTNVTQAEAVVEIGKEEILRSGTRWVGHKSTTLTGTGTITGYKVTSRWVERIGSIANDRGKPLVTELTFKLDDPEAWGAYRVRLKGVQFDRIDLLKYEVGQIVEEELPFTFAGFDLLDRVVES